jgi:tRNA (guanine-N7-)-methyltransferase
MRPRRRLPLEELAPYLLEARNPPTVLDWRSIFQNDHPVEIEVGFGKGLFLITAAEARPAVNFVGIEISRKYQLFTATRLAKRSLTNIRLANADARTFLRDYVPGLSVQAIHFYFPDPWWKTRHLKRRVFTPESVAQCARVLAHGGRLHIATDVKEYFDVITRLVASQGQLNAISLSPLGSGVGDEGLADHGLEYLTNFERKFRKEGRPIYRAVYEREA